MSTYRNAGAPFPPMVELRSIRNGGRCRCIDGRLRMKLGWHKDSELTGAIRVLCDEDGTKDYMCASVHVTPEAED